MSFPLYRAVSLTSACLLAFGLIRAVLALALLGPVPLA